MILVYGLNILIKEPQADGNFFKFVDILKDVDEATFKLDKSAHLIKF